jgi:Mg-chelatase subunit ChlD
VPTSAPVDVVLVIDRSGSMKGDPLARAKDAAKVFIDRMNLATDHIAIISFSDKASIDQQLTQDARAAKAAVNRLRDGGGTRINLGIDQAVAELQSKRHQRSATPVIILLTDGVSPEDSALRSADAAKRAGIRMITIGLGHNVNKQLLRQIASSEHDYYFAPTSSDLQAIYLGIAQSIGCGASGPQPARLISRNSPAAGQISLSSDGHAISLSRSTA